MAVETEVQTADPEEAKFDEIFPASEDPDLQFPSFGEPTEPEPVEEAAVAPEPAAPEPERSEEDQHALERALAALRRAKVPFDDWDDEKALSVGAGLAETQSYTDRIASELGELRKGNESREEESQAEPPSQVAVDLDELVAPLREQLGDDAGNSVAGLVKAAVSGARREQASQIDALTKSLRQSNAMMHELQMDRVRSGLQERFPQLREDSGWTPVREKADKALRSGVHNDLGLMEAYKAAFDDAVRAVHGNPVDRPKEAAVDRARDLGSPMTSRRAAESPNGFASQDDKDNAILMAIERGDRQEAQRLGGLPITK